MKYAELVCQTNFSFLKGASDPEELVTTASFLGYEALAITDECSVAGIVRAYSEIKHNNLPLKLIVGSRFCLDETLEIVLLCPDQPAYTELCRVITNARRRSPKGEYSLTEWDLKTLRHCLIIWLPNTSDEYNDQWGKWLYQHHCARCWIGAQRLLDDNDTTRFKQYRKLHQTYQFPITACTGALFHHGDRLPLQHVLQAISAGTTVDKLGAGGLSNAERCLRPLSKLKKLYPATWLEESAHLAALCHFSMSSLEYKYPAEVVPPNHTASSYLRECVEQGIVKRFGDEFTPELRATIEKELKLIFEQKYEYFFLTIYDIVQFAQRQSILYQGRGSAANSVVCYCLEITAADPRQISLLFERFISKERDECPDIDVDFEHERREEIIQYIYQKYGRKRTALAATVITFRFRSAFREVGKALGFPESQLSFILKNINRRDKTLPWQSQLVQCGLPEDNPKVRQLVNLVEEIIGFPRHLSQHVGGFVISSGPLYELVPVENAAMPERTVIQWDKDDLETLSLLKVDVLALGMLTAIRKTFQLVTEQPLSIPFITRQKDDPDVFDMICKADTVGVFQIESRAQMTMLPRLKPHKYYDLVVQIAIVRPGPIQGEMVHPYLKRRNGQETPHYPSKEVKDVLQRTYGVPIFQEQVIQLAMVAAGFSGGEADQLRRAMANWKKKGQLNKFKDKLINGMLARGYTPEYAETLYEQIRGFSGYGFPESHSASFAVLAYVSCWLKYYFKVEFYVGLLNSWPMGFYTPSQLIQDARQHNIAVLPVCVNSSDVDHTMCVHNGKKSIRLGFRQIKGLPVAAAEALVQARPVGGFIHIDDIKKLNLHNSSIEALASADALAAISGNRFQARWQIMDTQPTLPLFASSQEQDLLPLSPTKFDNLVEDYNSTSLSLTQHPISLIAEQQDLSRFTFANALAEKSNKSVVHVIGCVTGRQAPGTATGVTFFTLEDHTGNISVVVWQATARHQQQPYLKANILQVDGILERSPEGVMHVIAGKLTDRSDWIEPLKISSRDFQ
ncbi:error-prone DNA polymerase [Alteromonas pelagimontana]|uniref:Error-prone DNA polymerase n=1 Tax=Alteromonas pelagimontana TaxID=1858656 RepID=A0A6M4MCV6_9ALTE|nr:error-prone DNA polymerase [Alteromonas pelagimontana]QJR81014.1 error-prone DNA polymerase [Alteromonas pelagimontana]